MKTKNLNSALFGSLKLKNADMNNLKGGQGVIDSCYSGCGRNGSGGYSIETCVVFSDGSSSMIDTPTAKC